MRERLSRGADALRAKLEEHALPVLQGWYGRLRRDHVTTDACTVAAHMAFIFTGVTESGPHAMEQAPAPAPPAPPGTPWPPRTPPYTLAPAYTFSPPRRPYRPRR